MTTKTLNNIKLGVFVLSALLLLTAGLYLIGKDTNIFGRNFELKARFDNVQGLTTGNNVRYSGIQVGTVKRVKILTDTVIEITMLIEEDMRQFIHKNDMATISTDGLMGNKLINIIPAKDYSPLVEENDILRPKKGAGTDAMIETLDQTNRNLLVISENIKHTVERINQNNALWKTLEDPDLAEDISQSTSNIRKATSRADQMILQISEIVDGIRNGKGSLGSIITDTSIAHSLSITINKIQKVGDDAGILANELSALALNIREDISNGNGTVHLLLKDTTFVKSLNSSVANIEAGTAAFNENMEALKHNFLTRGYFRKQERKKVKQGY